MDPILPGIVPHLSHIAAGVIGCGVGIFLMAAYYEFCRDDMGGSDRSAEHHRDQHLEPAAEAHRNFIAKG